MGMPPTILHHCQQLTYQSIYKEIGPGKRIALAKLAADHFAATGKPFRLAIDTSIWLFQIQSGKGIDSSLHVHNSLLTYRQVDRILPFAPSITDYYA